MKKSDYKKKNDPPYTNKATLTVYLVLRALVIFVLVRAALRRDFESVFFCGMTLVLMILPSFFARKLNVELPGTLEIIILLFIYAAEIMGEIGAYYVTFPYWDTVLHTLNGFLCAAIGFSLLDILNRHNSARFHLSPLYLAIVAFCFSMTVGVLWEFFEYTGDCVMGWDMQKDTVVNSIHTVELDTTRSNKVVTIDDIADVIIVHSDGSQEALGLGGYLDIGIHDTMKDLLVNFIGAMIFSFIGYFYVKEKNEGGFAAQFIPRVRREDGEK